MRTSVVVTVVSAVDTVFVDCELVVTDDAADASVLLVGSGLFSTEAVGIHNSVAVNANRITPIDAKYHIDAFFLFVR